MSEKKNGFMSFLEAISPWEGGDEQQPLVVAPPQAPAPQAPAAPVAVVAEEELSAPLTAAAADQYIVPRAPVYLPRVKIPQMSEEDVAAREARETKFSGSLEALKNEYRQAQEDAARREMLGQVFAAVGDNAGLISSGLQSMNTKAATSAPNVGKITVKDLQGQADSRFKTQYDGLLKQYKDLKQGQLTPKDLLYAEIANSQIAGREASINANVQNTDRNAGVRVTGMKLADEKGNELTDKQVESMKDLDTNLASMDGILADASKFKDKLGPNAADYEAAKEGRLGVVVPGKIDKDFVEFRHKLKSTKAAYQKMLSGLTLTPAEMTEMQGYIPNERMPYEALTANAKAFKKRVRELKERELKGLAKFQGKNVKGYATSETSTAPATIKIQGPSGQVATVRADQAEKYLSKPGYKKVD